MAKSRQVVSILNEQQFAALLEIRRARSHRSVAIVGASIVEQTLKIALQHRLRYDFPKGDQERKKFPSLGVHKKVFHI
jgi:hypothetical protein